MVSYRLTRKEETRALEEILLIDKGEKRVVFNIERKGWYVASGNGARKRIKEEYIIFNFSKSDFEEGRSLNPNIIPHGIRKLNKKTGTWIKEDQIGVGSQEEGQLNSYLFNKIKENYNYLDSEIRKKYTPEKIFYLFTHVID
ncbi:MAG TPA: hypothetical protein P5277_01600 [Candidatus Paceibacterota bacterium]|nr:hypothetical protein [Candidatus Paceibacterota bacterium]